MNYKKIKHFLRFGVGRDKLQHQGGYFCHLGIPVQPLTF